jgi:SAM-dependent methyltransferase
LNKVTNQHHEEHKFEEWRLQACDTLLAHYLRFESEPKLILDVGCGYGHLLAAAQRRIDGLMIAGVDGPWVDMRYLRFDPQHFYTRNFEVDPLDLTLKPDLVTCVEVAEHLNPNCAASFCGELVSYGAPVLFSAAVPGQGGQGHKNEQYTSYWAKIFNSYGYFPIDFLHPLIWVDDSLPFWLRQNPVFFYPLSRITGWRTSYMVRDFKLLDRVHPELHKRRRLS